MAKGCLTVRITIQTGMYLCMSAIVIRWCCVERPSPTNKRYARDNRLMILESPYWRNCLAPRCRLFASWGCIRSQWFGCSPIKAERELGSERRETVRFLSTIFEKIARTKP